jgi:hypothetical protein
MRTRIGIVVILTLAFAAATFGQAKPVAKPIIFAVLNNGEMIEPLALVDKGKLTDPTGGDADSKDLTKFNKTYYSASKTYRLIFGAANAGTVNVKKTFGMECSPNMAQVSTISTRAKLKGFVMGLATNVVTKTKGSGIRRLPTPTERAEVDALVKAEFAKNKVTDKELKYHNLTAMDVDGDGKIEMIGSYWMDTDPKARQLMFVIAQRDSSGKYELSVAETNGVKEDNVMSGDIANVDEGVYHEMLLDAFDFDGNGVAEIFTYTQSFEGAGFNAYSRSGGKWTKTFEGSNYHCGY